MKDDTGGFAFPLPMASLPSGGVVSADEVGGGGMTMRDYFAAKAMQGIFAHHDTWGMTVDQIVAQSYAAADAMLAERAK